MADLFCMKWNDLSRLEFVQYTMYNTGVIWLGRTALVIDSHSRQIGACFLIPPEDLISLFNVTDTKTRECIINRGVDWKNFSDSCYVLGCKDNKTWRDAEGKKLPLKEWADEKRHKQEFIRDRPFDNDIIITVYDTDKQKRLIIDGIHRATILTNECENRHVELLSPMRVWECYGKQVITIFPCDIIQLN
jgi:hypothetical protein